MQQLAKLVLHLGKRFDGHRWGHGRGCQGFPRGRWFRPGRWFGGLRWRFAPRDLLAGHRARIALEQVGQRPFAAGAVHRLGWLRPLRCRLRRWRLCPELVRLPPRVAEVTLDRGQPRVDLRKALIEPGVQVQHSDRASVPVAAAVAESAANVSNHRMFAFWFRPPEPKCQRSRLPAAGVPQSLRDCPRRASRKAYAAAPKSDTATSATCVGVRPTRTPLASSASALAAAVPLEPDTIAPAWPMVLPCGAVKPAM